MFIVYGWPLNRVACLAQLKFASVLWFVSAREKFENRARAYEMHAVLTISRAYREMLYLGELSYGHLIKAVLITLLTIVGVATEVEWDLV